MNLCQLSLARHGFTEGTRFAIQLQQAVLCLAVVSDNAAWEELCEASQHNPALGADWVQDNGQLVIGGDWLTEMGITEAGHVDVVTAPDIIIIQRRVDGVLRA